MHYGAVNIKGDLLLNGVNLNTISNELVFFNYNGPSPPFYLWFIRRQRRNLFIYEWIITKQLIDNRTLPILDQNFQVDYKKFLNETENPISSYFVSGFCAR